jgi:transposase InsO family protein
MTPTSVWDYAATLRPRYRAGDKRERGLLLDEFCRNTGYHRKAAVRLLHREGSPERGRRGRTPRYGQEVVTALVQIWEASDQQCGKRLAPFLPELLASMERHGELAVSADVRAQLVRLSAATIDRLLRPARQHGLRRPWGGRRPAPNTLRAQIPVRTFGEWQGVQPGCVQADLVLHCGETTEGFYLTTLTVVDVATSWTECRAVWGLGKLRVCAALHEARGRLPFPLQELHTDNGSEFLNRQLYPYCQREGIRMTRGRPYRKNDQAYVEQKNGDVVRKRVGYQRFSSAAALKQLARVYDLVHWYANFFQPVRKVVAKERVGATIRKRYDVAQTPYQRLLAAGVLTTEQHDVLADIYRRLNPTQLRGQLGQALDALWKLAEPQDSFRANQSARAPAVDKWLRPLTHSPTTTTAGNSNSEASLDLR